MLNRLIPEAIWHSDDRKARWSQQREQVLYRLFDRPLHMLQYV